MLSELQIRKIRTFFKKDIETVRMRHISKENMKLLYTYNIDPFTMQAIGSLWQDVDCDEKEHYEKNSCKCC